MQYPTPARTASGSRVGFHYFTTRAEAEQAAAYWQQDEHAATVDAANIGIAQVGTITTAADGLFQVVVP